MGPKRGADGRLTFALPMGDKKLPGIAAEDIGKVALGILARGTEYLGKTVGIAGEHLTGEEMARALGAAFGEPVRYDAIALEAYRHFPMPGADELANMFQFKQEHNESFCDSRDVALTRSLSPELQTFAGWLAANKHRLAFERLAA